MVKKLGKGLMSTWVILEGIVRLVLYRGTRIIFRVTKRVC